MAGKDTVAVRLTLDGAEDVKRQLDRLGAAGKAFLDGFKKGGEDALPGFSKGVDATLARVSKAFQTAGAARDRFSSGLARLKIDMLGVGQAAGTVATRIGLVTGALGTAAGAALLLGKNFIQAADEASRMADRVGLSLQEFTGLAAVAKTFDIEPGDLVSGIERLNVAIEKGSEDADELTGKLDDVEGATKRTASAARDLSRVEVFKQLENGALSTEKTVIRVHRGIEDLGKTTEKVSETIKKDAGKQTVFQKLGLDLTKLQAQAPFERLMSIADALDRIEDPARRSALALQLMGRGGGRLISLLGKGSGTIREAIREMERYGVILGTAEEQTIQLADDGLDRLGLAFQGLQNRLGLAFAPLIGRVADIFAQLIVNNRGLVESVAGVAAAYTELALLDIVSIVLGNDAQVSSTNKWMLAVRDGIVAIGTFIYDTVTNVVVPAFELIRSGAEIAAAAINGVFGTEITGDQVLAGALALKLVGAFTLITAAGNLVIGMLNLLLAALPAVRLVFGGLFTVLRGLAFALGFIGAAIATVLGVPVAVGVAIAAAIAAASALIYVYWDEIVAYASGAWETIKALGGDAWDLAVAAAQDALASLQPIFDSLTILAQVVWGTIRDLGLAAWDGIKELASDALTTVQEGLAALGRIGGDAWAAIKAGALDLWNSLPTDFEAARALLVAGFNAIPGLLGAAWEAVKAGAASAWASIVEGAQGLAARVRPALEAIGPVVTAIWNGISDLAQQAWDGVTGIVSDAAAGIASAVSAVARAALDAWSGASASVADSAQVIVDAISKASDIAGNVTGAENLAAALVQPFSSASTRIDGVLLELQRKVDRAMQAITDKIGATLAAARQAPAYEGGDPTRFGEPSANVIDTTNARTEFQQLVSSFESARQVIGRALADILGYTSDVALDIKGEFSNLASSLSLNFTVAQAEIIASFAAFGAQIPQQLAIIGDLLAVEWQAVVEELGAASGTFLSAWQLVLSDIESSFARTVDGIEGLIDRLESRLASLRASINAAASSASSGGSSSSEEPAFARGGMVHGSGGPTQDNIPAWLSAGEFVIRAAAVKKLPISFLRVLNSGRFDLSDIMRRFSSMRFAAGGLVPGGLVSTPLRFASGGLVPAPVVRIAPFASAGAGSARPSSALTLVLDGKNYEGMTGPADTVEALARAVSARKLRMAGRTNPYDMR
jgi:phage-related protein